MLEESNKRMIWRMEIPWAKRRKNIGDVEGG